MKCLFKVMRAFLFFTVPLMGLALPFSANAGWQVAKPDAVIPSDPFFQAGLQQKTTFGPAPRVIATPIIGSPCSTSAPLQRQFARLGRPAAGYAISISGSLKENLERIMCRYQWKIVWRAPYDYNFDGHVTGSSLPNVVERVLKPFPLQAVMYVENRTMVVIPRQRR